MVNKMAQELPKSTITVKLVKPIAVDGAEPIKAVEMREPKAGELRGLKFVSVMEGDVDSMVTLIPRITTLTERQIINLSPVNLTPLIGGVLNFFVEDDSSSELTE